MNTQGENGSQIHVTAIATDEFDVNHQEGMTVGEAVDQLREALGFFPDAKYTPVIRGLPVRDEYVLQPGDHIILMIHSKGGSI